MTLRLADAGAIDGFAPPPGATETLAVFRRQPLGRDAAGREYHAVGIMSGEGGVSLSARLYRCTPAPPHAVPESEETRRARRAREAAAVAGAGRAVHDPTWLQSARSELDLLDPPAMAGWELVAEGLAQLAALGAALQASADTGEVGLGTTIAQALVPHLRAAAEEHERQRAR